MWRIRAAVFVTLFPAKGIAKLWLSPSSSTRQLLRTYWRAIVLFGRNVATYKFALAQALLELRPASGQLVTLEELAAPYTRHLREHLRLADKQGTFQRSQFLDACRNANAGGLSEQQLLGRNCWNTSSGRATRKAKSTPSSLGIRSPMRLRTWRSTS